MTWLGWLRRLRWLVFDVVRVVGVVRVVEVVRVDEVIRVVRVVEVARVFGVVEVIRVVRVIEVVELVRKLQGRTKAYPTSSAKLRPNFYTWGAGARGGRPVGPTSRVSIRFCMAIALGWACFWWAWFQKGVR